MFGIAIFNWASAATQEIDISEMRFTPAVVDINQGDTVRWINRDTTDHLIKGAFGNSSTLAPNQTYEFVFNQAGNFDYICELHPSMTGTIRVAAVSVKEESAGAVNFSDLFGTGDDFAAEDISETVDLPQLEEPVQSAPVSQPTPAPVVTPPSNPTPVVNNRTINTAPPTQTIARAASSNQSLPTAGGDSWLTYLVVLAVLGGLFFVGGVSRR